ncbi:Putative ribonuclease H protein At1g65750 [Linum perenne]
MTTDAVCSLCRKSEESVAHVLRDCEFAAESWSKLEGFNTRATHWRGDVAAWLGRGLRAGNCLLFGVHCWLLWKNRNERVFAGSDCRPNAVAIRSIKWAEQVKEALDRTVDPVGNNACRRTEVISWTPGPSGWLVLNTDGSVDHRTGKAVAGGLVRDAEGRCLLAFTMNIGICSITRAEMRGAIEGLHRAWDAGFRRVLLRMDSRVAMSLLAEGDTVNNHHAMESLRFQSMMGKEWEVKLEHTYREGNKAADFLAGIGYGYPYGSHTFDISDCRLGYFLRLDSFGVGQPRSVLIND